MGKLVDLTGKKFGRLTVISRGNEARRARWLCRCDCGSERAVSSYCLTSRATTGCVRCASRIIDLTGQVFGRLTVVGLDPVDVGKHLKWVCLCRCGNEKSIRGSHLKGGKVLSCGCYNTENLSVRATTHGHSKNRELSRTYVAYRSMVTRCYTPSSTSYPHYGARGVTVCDRWLESFENFLADMGECPPGLSLDRIDGSLGYAPGNCRYATAKQQARNQKTNRLITYDGRTLTLAEWAEKLGVRGHVISRRIDKYGWTIKEALTTPARVRSRGD